jgi:hypothetical protein
MSTYKERTFSQKELVDRFFAEKQEIGKVEKDGSVTLSSEDSQLFAKVFAYQAAQLLKAKLQLEDESNLNDKGLSRKRRKDYALASTIHYIVNQKLESNMAKDQNYTPTLAEEIALINHVSAEQYKRSLASFVSDSEDEE